MSPSWRGPKAWEALGRQLGRMIVARDGLTPAGAEGGTGGDGAPTSWRCYGLSTSVIPTPPSYPCDVLRLPASGSVGRAGPHPPPGDRPPRRASGAPRLSQQLGEGEPKMAPTWPPLAQRLDEGEPEMTATQSPLPQLLGEGPGVRAKAECPWRKSDPDHDERPTR